MPKITFSREKKVVECQPGANLRQVALDSGVELYPGMKRHLNCRGKGLCGECRVHIIAGKDQLGPKTAIEKLRIGVSWFKFGHEDEVRLACQTSVLGDVEVYTQPEFNWFGKAF